MRKIVRKTGFALVECVVAIAVFTIMAMIIAMLLNAAIVTHNKNVQEVRSIRNQKHDIVAGNVDPRSNDSLVLNFGGAVGTVTYEFDAKISDRGAVGLELTEFYTDLSGPKIDDKPIMPISLSALPWKSIVTERKAGIGIMSQNSSILRNDAMTKSWGDDATPMNAGIPAVNTKNLFTYKIPAPALTATHGQPGFINDRVAVWENAASYNDWLANPTSANRGTRPSGALYAHMIQVVVNRTIEAQTDMSQPPCTIRLHVPKSVVGIVFSSELNDKIWLVTNNTEDPLFNDIILARPAGDPRFTTFNFAIITKEHIKPPPKDKNTGDLREWLRLKLCQHGNMSISCTTPPC